MKATAIAPSNIALVKYWGRRDDALVLPQNSNFSMTFGPTQTNPAGVHTTTTIEFSRGYAKDVVAIDGSQAAPDAYARTVKHIDIVRKMASVDLPFRMESRNNFPY